MYYLLQLNCVRRGEEWSKLPEGLTFVSPLCIVWIFGSTLQQRKEIVKRHLAFTTWYDCNEIYNLRPSLDGHIRCYSWSEDCLPAYLKRYRGTGTLFFVNQNVKQYLGLQFVYLFKLSLFLGIYPKKMIIHIYKNIYT